MNSKFFTTCQLILLSALAPVSVTAVKHYPDTVMIPERSVVIGTERENAPADLIAILYSRENLDFQDPRAPRFLFLDRSGKVALGIGGYVKGTMAYDFCGTMDNGGSTTYDIAVPDDPASRNKFNMDASHSTLFLKMVGRTSKLGYLTMYIQTNFTGNNGGYGMKLKQAYIQLGYVTAGLARSSFEDPSGPPTIDAQGPCGEVSAKNVQLQYAPVLSDHWRMGVSIENPKASYTCIPGMSEPISQRCPDIPAYIQYGQGDNHVRLSGLFRQLSYRDMAAGRNHFVTGWGVQLSGQTQFGPGFTFYYGTAYGKGIAHYLNDLDGQGLDLINDGGGRMKAPATFAFTGGLQYDFSPRLFVSASYSQCRLYGQRTLGADAYRYGQYLVANAFYTIIPDCMLGIEYNYGSRTDCSGTRGDANRIYAAIQYSF